MDCKEFQNNLVDFLYDEIYDSDLRQRMTGHAKECEECRRTLEDFGVTRNFLAAWESPPIEMKPTISYKLKQSRSWRDVFVMPPRWVGAAALFVMVLGIFLSVFSISFHVNEGVVEIRFGDGPYAYSAENMRVLRTIDQMIAESEERQTDKTLDLLQNVYYRIEDERRLDRQSLQEVFDICGDQLDKNNLLMEMTMQNLNYQTSTE